MSLFKFIEKGDTVWKEKITKNKTICLNFNSKNFYKECMENHQKYRKHLTDTYTQYPELFPADFSEGFNFHDIVSSEKQDSFIMRRIMLKNQSRDVYQIRTSFMMPYMIAETADVKKAIYLRRWGAPFDALAYLNSGVKP